VGDPGQTLKNGFNTPEASAAENCCLLFCHGSLDALGNGKFHTHSHHGGTESWRNAGKIESAFLRASVSPW
jgi:hypothetical protein